MEKTENKSTFDSKNNSEISTVKIANDVIASIAALAAMEVDGVTALSGNLTAAAMQKASYRKLARAVKVQLSGKKVKADVSLLMGYGFNIPATSQKVQTRVKSTIESMTGLEVTDVNVRIEGITVAGN
jgi:uncharacterized alkaline shock family protein YloU